MPRRKHWRCITVHSGDLAEPAVASSYGDGVYAIGMHFGSHLGNDQHDAQDWPMWWTEAERTPEHDTIAERAGITL